GDRGGRRVDEHGHRGCAGRGGDGGGDEAGRARRAAGLPGWTNPAQDVCDRQQPGRRTGGTMTTLNAEIAEHAENNVGSAVSAASALIVVVIRSEALPL